MPTDRSLRNGALVTAALISLVAGESALADSKGGGHSETKTPIRVALAVAKPDRVAGAEHDVIGAGAAGRISRTRTRRRGSF
jgi:hypothetical protein